MPMISIRVSDPTRLTNPAAWIAAIATSFGPRLLRALQSAWCVMNGGHYKLLHTEPDRMALRCVACGHMSPGWSVGSPRLARTTPADRERLRTIRSRLVA